MVKSFALILIFGAMFGLSMAQSPSLEDQYHHCSEDYGYNQCENYNGVCGDNGICTCPSGTTFSWEMNKCLIPDGGDCNGNEGSCYPGAGCQEDTKTCYCDPSMEGCNPSHIGEYCSKTRVCSSEAHLDCIDGKCQCESQAEMNQHSASGRCEAHNAGTCTPDGTLKCSGETECNDGKCVCPPGYSFEKYFSSCKKAFGTQCADTMNECNGDQGLVCKNETCVCREKYQTWDEERSQCVAEIGRLCSANSGCADPNASCQHNPAKMERPMCRCNKGFVGMDGTCVPDPELPGCNCPNKKGDFWEPMPKPI